MDKINEKALSGLSIHALRVLGRDLGVKQPTSLKKEDLICEIMLIHNGEKAPYVPTNKKGRPPKANEKTIKDFSFLPENDEKTFSINDLCEFFELNANLKPFNYDDLPEEEYEKKREVEINGYLEQINDYGFIKDKQYLENRSIFVSDNQIIANNLRQGDFISAIGKIIHPSRAAMLTKINKINYGYIDKRDIFENLKLSNKSKTLLEKDKNILQLQNLISGSRNLIKVNSRINLINQLYSFANKCSNIDNVNVVCLFMDVMPENRVELVDKENLEVFCTLFENTPSQNLSMMLIAIDRVKRLAELGKDVILIVDGIEGVIDCTINGYNIEDSISGTVNVIAKKIFALARNFDKGNSVSVVAKIFPKGNERLLNELEYVSTSIINL